GLKLELQKKQSYISACKELCDWLKDAKAYERPVLDGIYSCLEIISKRALAFGLQVGFQVTSVAAEHIERLRSIMGSKVDDVLRWRNELASKLSPASVARLSPLGGPMTPTFPKTLQGQNMSQLLQMSQTPQPTKSQASLPMLAQTSGGYSNVAGPIIPTRSGVPITNVQSTTSSAPSAQSSIVQTQGNYVNSVHRGSMNYTASVQQSTVPSSPSVKHDDCFREPGQDSNKHAALFCRPFEYAVKPQVLQHKAAVTPFTFTIMPNLFKRLYSPDKQYHITVNTPLSHLPLTYVLKSCKAASAIDDKCEWPDGLRVFLNRMEVKLEKKTKTPVPNRQGQFTYTGRDRPADLRPYLREGENLMCLEQTTCCCSYRFSVEILLRESEDLILHYVRRKHLSEQDGITNVDRLLSGGLDDDDIEVRQEVIKVSMKCPLSLLRIKEPVKGAKCRHVACFDLSSYLAVNRANQTWRCPDCHNKVYANDLRVDKFFMKLLKEVPDKVETVELGLNGTWKPVADATQGGDGEASSDEDETATGTRSRNSQAEVVVLADSDDEEAAPPPSRPQLAQTRSPSQSTSAQPSTPPSSGQSTQTPSRIPSWTDSPTRTQQATVMPMDVDPPFVSSVNRWSSSQSSSTKSPRLYYPTQGGTNYQL
ncbi:2335_t:CDS:2, partial [Paraglomus occultum]